MNKVRTCYHIGILGAGQLAKMLVQDALRMGMKTSVWSSGSGDPALSLSTYSKVCDLSEIGNFFENCDAILLESEFYAPEKLQEVLGSLATRLRPSLGSYSLLREKLAQRKLCTESGVPSIPFSNQASVYGYPQMLKFSTGGYDGKGNMLLTSPDQWDAMKVKVDADNVFFEPYLKIKKELALCAVSNGSEIQFYPLVQTYQYDHICHWVETVQSEHENELKAAAEKIIRKTKYQGLLACEFIETTDEDVYLNETACRVHNSGHVMSDFAECSQFENHIRAVLQLPLGSTKARYRYGAMFNILGAKDYATQYEQIHRLLTIPGTSLYLYGKEHRPGRKLGHLNFCSNDEKEFLKYKLEILKSMEIPYES